MDGTSLLHTGACDLLTVAAKGFPAERLTVCGLAILRLTIRTGLTVSNWLGTESLMGLLDTIARDLLWGSVDRSGLRSIDRSGLSVDGLSVDGSGLSIDGSGLSIDRLTVNWLHTIGGWSGVYNLGLLNMSRCETILSLSLCLAHLTKQANRSLFLGSTIVEATNETEIHGL